MSDSRENSTRCRSICPAACESAWAWRGRWRSSPPYFWWTSPAAVSICFPNNSENVGDPVEVAITSTFKFIPILKLGSVTIKRTATMRLEAAPTNYSAVGTC